jgi:hypothetical protein
LGLIARGSEHPANARSGALCHAAGREKEKNRERDMARIGIENISVFGLPPVEFVNLAGDLACQHISTGLSGYAFGVHDYPIYSLREKARRRREMKAAMRDRGVSILLAEASWCARA